MLGAKGFAAFTVDIVAERAGVARMTVYYQFGSKAGLIDAMFDDLAGRGLIDSLGDSASRSEPFEALGELIGAFVGFWASDRVVIRRLRGLSALDARAERSARAGDGRRREALRAIVGRLEEQRGRPPADPLDETVGVLHTLTSFETFDSLAGESRSPEEVATQLIRVAHSVVEFDR